MTRPVTLNDLATICVENGVATVSYPSCLFVRVWPDGTAVTLDDLQDGDYSHMSDDYRDVDVSDPVKMSYLSEQEHSAVLACFKA
jgi:hypothetical protein